MTPSERFILSALGVAILAVIGMAALGELMAFGLSALAYILDAVFDLRWPSVHGLASYWATNQKFQAMIVVVPIFFIGLLIWGFIKTREGQWIMGRIFRIVIWPKTENEKSSAIVRLGRVWHWLAALVAAGSFGLGCLIAWHEENGFPALIAGIGAGLLILLVGRAGRYILSNE